MPRKKSNLNNACSKDARRMRVKRARESEKQIAARNAAQRIRTAEIRRQESREQRDERKNDREIMYISVKNIYKYEILSSNNIKLENERDTTEETLCLLSPHQPIEVNIIPDCESESLQGREEPLCNSYDTYNEVTDPVIIEGTEFIKYEDHEIKNEAESESLQGREEPLGNGYDAYNEVTDPVAFEGIEFIKYEDHEIKNEAPAHHVDHSVSVAAAGLATSTNTCYYR